jgi:hypothetical protein
MAGVYANYSKWIRKEISIASSYGKPIIAVEPWGAELTPLAVKNAADQTVRWQGKSIADAIRAQF